MDDVHVRERLVGRKHVRRLLDYTADRRLRLRVEKIGRDRAFGLAHCEQPHLVAEVLQTPGEVVDDDLGPAIGRWWHWHPRRGYQADTHLYCLLASSRVTITRSAGSGGKHRLVASTAIQRRGALPSRNAPAARRVRSDSPRSGIGTRPHGKQ